MTEELNLVKDLAIILIAAGLFTIISKALKQPLILGYIIAGFIVGPHLGLFGISSKESVEQWSEIGIIFLLFALGLEFSFKKLLKVGSSALITAGCVCVGMFVTGNIVGHALGWSSMESIFLGGLMSMSSTTIIIKAYTDLGLKNKAYSTLVFGTLVVEDLIAVVLMVLLTTIATANQFAGGEMLMGLAKLLFFLILWFLVGIYIIPSFLKWARKYLTDEILLPVAIGLCFGMVTLASFAGFSSALGAFVMGSILSETIEGEHISKLVVSIKDLFGAIFFVSVGMMVDPQVIAQHWVPILILTVVTVIGMTLFGFLGALVAGRGLNTAVHTGFSLAQLGEFSFIIAGLGVSLGVMRGFIYPVIIAVSVITTFTTPYMIKAATPVCNFLYKKLPVKLLAKLDPSPDASAKASEAEQSEWRHLLKRYALRVLLYGVILIAIFLGSRLYLDKLLSGLLPDASAGLRNAINLAVTLLLMSPFLYGLAVNGGDIKHSAVQLMKEKDSNKWPVLALIFLRIFAAIAFVIATVLMHYSLSYWSLLLIVLAGVAFFILARRSVHQFTGLEERFITNLNQKEEYERKRAPIAAGVRAKMKGHDVAAENVIISPNSEYAGRQLKNIPFRQKYGINIAKVIRGSRRILVPSPEEYIYPYDEVLAIGTKEEVKRFVEDMTSEALSNPVSYETDDFVLDSFELQKGCYLDGKVLRDTNMRQKGCMVVGVERDGLSLMSPKPDFRFQAGDFVWLAGERVECEKMVLVNGYQEA
ncbi:MAG: cation:proton antiporter [Bacteroidales bacterium]|nr:cation:proton antiporter [Bacteroidales bacterium]